MPCWSLGHAHAPWLAIHVGLPGGFRRPFVYTAVMLRWAAFAVVLSAVAGTTHASYELGLMLQGQKVHRYDPISGAYFGSFDLLANATGMTAYRSTGLAYVLGVDTVYRYDYSTGVSRGRFSIPAGAQSIREGMDDDELLIGYADRVERRSASTGALLGSPLAFGPSIFSHAQGAIAQRTSGLYYLLANDVAGDDFLVGMDAASSVFGAYRSQGPWTGPASSMYGGDVDGDSLTFLTRDSDFSWGSAPTEMSVVPGAGDPSYVFGIALFSSTRPASIQYGHEGSVTFLSNPSGQWTFRRGYVHSLTVMTPRTLSFLDGAQDVRGYTLLVAPEPGALAALGIGLLAVLRRRRR